MELFNKKISIKNTACVCKKKEELVNIPINLYIQSVNKCNAYCSFCNPNINNNFFNYSKLEEIIIELNKKINIGKISITGGEPLLEFERIKKIAEIGINNHQYMTLNTNAYDINLLKNISNYFQEIDISKHHYNESINYNIMKLKTASIQEISKCDFLNKISINCVIQRKGINSYIELINMLEYISDLGIKSLKGIGLLPLTDYAIKNKVDLIPIMNECEQFLNDGYLYDFNWKNNECTLCQCFEFLYRNKNNHYIKTTLKQTFNDDTSYVKQFVYDGEYLYDGFQKKNIIY